MQFEPGFQRGWNLKIEIPLWNANLVYVCSSQRMKAAPPVVAGAGRGSSPVRGLRHVAFQAKAQRHDRWPSVAVCVFLVLAVWAVFGQTLHYEFVNYDDEDYVCGNPTVARGLNWTGVFWAFTHRVSSNWHPLTMLSHMLDCQLYGLNPGGHHFTNVLLHAAAAILLFLLLRNLTGAFWRSAFVAAVFAIHPLRVESVAWVSERKDVLSGLFFMLTIWAYARYAGGKSKPEGASQKPEQKPLTNDLQPLSSPFYWTALMFFALGLMSKPMLVTLPFLLLLLDYWPLRRFTIHNSQPTLAQLAWEKIPFLVLSTADCVATVLAQQRATVPFQSINFPARVGNALVEYVAYLGQMLYPVALAPFYPHPENRLSLWKIVLSLAVLLIITAGVLVWRRARPWLVVGWLWYVGMLVPVIGLLQVGGQARADRYTYLPQIGLYILLSWGAVELCSAWRYRRSVLGVAAASILCVLMAVSRAQTVYWKDSLSLWRHTLACTAENYVAYNSYANALMSQGQLEEAIQNYKRVIELKPNYAEAYIKLGSALTTQGKLEEAIQNHRRALELKPNYPELHVNLGITLAAQGNLPQAIEHYERALQLKPDFPQAHLDLGSALAGQGNLPQAIEHYQRALQLEPDFPQAHLNLGNSLAAQGKLAQAIEHYERALQLEPDFPQAHFSLGNSLAEQGKLPQAIEHYEQALNLAIAQHDRSLAQKIQTRLKSAQPVLSKP